MSTALIEDGSLIWKYKTGFEVDCSAAVIDGRSTWWRDGFFYCLSLTDGTLVYKTGRLGSMEGSSRFLTSVFSSH